MLLHSDGVVEAHSPAGKMFGFPRLMEAVATYPGGGELIDRVLTDLREHTGPDADQEDDITMVTLARAARGDGGAPGGATAQQVEFEVPSAEGNERLALARVSSIVGELGLEPERLRRLETAVGEATMNAMEHGNRYDADRPVTVRVLTHHDRVVVQIVDQGGGRPAHAPEQPDIDAKLAGTPVAARLGTVPDQEHGRRRRGARRRNRPHAGARDVPRGAHREPDPR